MFPKKSLIKLSLVIISLLPALGIALPSDSQAPWSLNAKQAHIDQKQGTHVYTGNVEFDQGTTHIRADKLVVTLKEGKIQKAVATGKPATYQTKPEPNKPLVDATAQTMEYYADQSLVILIGEAVVTQGENVMSGPRIEYNSETQVVVTPPTDKGRTSIIFVPTKAKP